MTTDPRLVRLHRAWAVVTEAQGPPELREQVGRGVDPFPGGVPAAPVVRAEQPEGSPNAAGVAPGATRALAQARAIAKQQPEAGARARVGSAMRRPRRRHSCAMR